MCVYVCICVPAWRGGGTSADPTTEAALSQHLISLAHCIELEECSGRPGAMPAILDAGSGAAAVGLGKLGRISVPGGGAEAFLGVAGLLIALPSQDLGLSIGCCRVLSDSVPLSPAVLAETRLPPVAALPGPPAAGTHLCERRRVVGGGRDPKKVAGEEKEGLVVRSGTAAKRDCKSTEREVSYHQQVMAGGMCRALLQVMPCLTH